MGIPFFRCLGTIEKRSVSELEEAVTDEYWLNGAAARRGGSLLIPFPSLDV